MNQHGVVERANCYYHDNVWCSNGSRSRERIRNDTHSYDPNSYFLEHVELTQAIKSISIRVLQAGK